MRGMMPKEILSGIFVAVVSGVIVWFVTVGPGKNVLSPKKPTLDPEPDFGNEHPEFSVTLRSEPTALTTAEIRSAIRRRGFTAYLPPSDPTGQPEQVIGTFRNSFKPHGSFVVDRATGLMWERSTSGPFTSEQAENHLRRLNQSQHGGFSNWRIPTIEELASLTQAKGVPTDFLVPEVRLVLNPKYFDGRYYFCRSSDRSSEDRYFGHELTISWTTPTHSTSGGIIGYLSADHNSYPVKAVRTIR